MVNITVRQSYSEVYLWCYKLYKLWTWGCYPWVPSMSTIFFKKIDFPCQDSRASFILRGKFLRDSTFSLSSDSRKILKRLPNCTLCRFHCNNLAILQTDVKSVFSPNSDILNRYSWLTDWKQYVSWYLVIFFHVSYSCRLCSTQATSHSCGLCSAPYDF